MLGDLQQYKICGVIETLILYNLLLSLKKKKTIMHVHIIGLLIL